MSLAGELRAAQDEDLRPGTRCTVCRLLLSLPPEDADALRDALGSDMKANTIARAVTRAGTRMAGYTIQRHRKGECLGLA